MTRVMEQTPRRDYLPRSQRWAAGRDRALSIGHGSTCSQPSTVATMLDLLDPAEGHRVLDVGSGSGWTTAMLARLVGPTGTVVGVELVPELVADSTQRLTRDGLIHARVEQASAGVLGLPDQAPYDRILVSAETDRLPEALVDQLADGGALVLPLDGRLVRLTRQGEELHRHTAPGWYRFVPLR